jgi:hypothetical protein
VPLRLDGEVPNLNVSGDGTGAIERKPLALGATASSDSTSAQRSVSTHVTPRAAPYAPRSALRERREKVFDPLLQHGYATASCNSR